jgi:hypothetical protein
MRMKAGLRLTLVAMLATAALVGTTAGPASALCAPPPGPPAADGRIRELPSGPFVGNNVYSFGSGQRALRSMDPSDKANFEVKFKNRGDTARGIFVHGFVDGDASNFRVRAFLGAVNVTDQVFTGGPLKLAGIAPGASSPGLRIEVKMKNGASEFASVEVLVHGAYKNIPSGCGDAPSAVAGFLT